MISSVYCKSRGIRSDKKRRQAAPKATSSSTTLQTTLLLPVSLEGTVQGQVVQESLQVAPWPKKPLQLLDPGVFSGRRSCYTFFGSTGLSGFYEVYR